MYTVVVAKERESILLMVKQFVPKEAIMIISITGIVTPKFSTSFENQTEILYYYFSYIINRSFM